MSFTLTSTYFTLTKYMSSLQVHELSQEITEEAEEEEAIAKERKDGSDAIANGCEKKTIEGDIGGKFMKVKGEVK
jgi:hypothetical protein